MASGIIAEGPETKILGWEQVRHWGLTLSEFSLVQMAVQLMVGMAGLLIVRYLSKSEYALFAITNSMQTMCNLLADWGIGIGLRSIGGRVWSDRQRFGQLLNTALKLRWYFALLSFGLCLPVAGWMLWRNGARPPQIIGLCLMIAIGVLPLLGASVWIVSPQLHGEYRRLQKLDFGNNALRLVLIGTLAVTRMNALLAAAVGVVGNWVQASFLRNWAREHADPAATPNANDQRELFSVSVKWLPNVVFFCFQGQVTLLILTLFGNPVDIADITALGRIAVLFTVFSTVFINVLAPRFARCQEPERLKRIYLLLVSASVLVLLPFFLFAWFAPNAFLWLLGEKYQHLGRECGWVVGAGCITQIAVVMWSLNSSKAWIKSQSFAFIPSILAAQVVAAICLDLHQFHKILIFNLITAVAPLPAYAIDAFLGFRSSFNKSHD